MSLTSAWSLGARTWEGPRGRGMQKWEKTVWNWTCIRSGVALAVGVVVDGGSLLNPAALWWWQNKKPNVCDSSRTLATLSDGDD